MTDTVTELKKLPVLLQDGQTGTLTIASGPVIFDGEEENLSVLLVNDGIDDFWK